MSNMSYCRFENTLRDLHECDDAIDNYEKLSQSEYNSRAALLKLCVDMLEKCNCVVELPQGGLESQFPPFEQQEG